MKLVLENAKVIIRDKDKYGWSQVTIVIDDETAYRLEGFIERLPAKSKAKR